MQPTYKILGADGNEYGPVSLDEFRAWVAEGRIGVDTQVLRSDQANWLPASSYTELGLAAAQPVAIAATMAAPAVRPIPAAAGVDPDLVKRIKGGASWFYWIAGLSLINSVVAMTGSNIGFYLGLGVTQFIDLVGANAGDGGKIIALVLDVIATALFILFGVFAGKGQTWAFVIGMILFGLDGVLTLLGQAWISFAFHAFALFCIFKGFQAARAAKR